MTMRPPIPGLLGRKSQKKPVFVVDVVDLHRILQLIWCYKFPARADGAYERTPPRVSKITSLPLAYPYAIY